MASQSKYSPKSTGALWACSVIAQQVDSSASMTNDVSVCVVSILDFECRAWLFRTASTSTKGSRRMLFGFVVCYVVEQYCQTTEWIPKMDQCRQI